MRVLLTLAILLGAAGGLSLAADRPILSLRDAGLPLEELTPLDRRVYIVTLTGKWHKPAAAGVTHYVNFYLPNGRHYAHAVNTIDERAFIRGDVRAMLYDYELRRGGVTPRGTVQIAVSHGRPAKTLNEPHIISEVVSLELPLYRPIERGGLPPLVPVPPAPLPEKPLPLPVPKGGIGE